MGGTDAYDSSVLDVLVYFLCVVKVREGRDVVHVLWYGWGELEGESGREKEVRTETKRSSDCMVFFYRKSRGHLIRVREWKSVTRSDASDKYPRPTTGCQ